MARRKDEERSSSSRKPPHNKAVPVNRRNRKPSITLVADQHGIYRIPLRAFHAIQHRFPTSLVATIPVEQNRRITDVVANVGERGAVVYCRADFLLRAWLEEAGFHVKLVLQPLGPNLATVDPDRLNQLIAPKWRVPERLTHIRSGQFEVVKPQDAAKLTIALTSAFPRAPCVIPLASWGEAVEFQQQLQKLTPEPVTLMCGRFRQLQSRITVCTDEAARHGVYDESPLIIVPKWPGSFHQRLKWLARHPHVERLFLIRTEQDRISEADETELLLRIGPLLWLQRLDVPRAQHVYHMVRFGGNMPRSGERGTARLDKRGTYWKHHARNRLLAGIAYQLVSHDGDGGSIAGGRPHVALLVESTEHAEILAGELPEWPVITQDNLPTSLPPICIVTLTAASEMRCFAPLYLINGCGGPASGWLASWLDERALALTAIRIVDLSDSYAGQTAALSANREASYRHAGAVWRPLEHRILKPALDALKLLTPVRYHVSPE